MPNVLEIKVPDIGDFEGVKVIEVLVSEGDSIARDDSIVSLESEKATVDVPSPQSGKVREVKVKVGDAVGEGSLLLLLEVDDASDPERPAPAKSPATGAAPPAAAAKSVGPSPPPAPPLADELLQKDFSRAYAAPGVRRFARKLGVDLTRVRGTGRKGRILEEDVQGWVKDTLAAPSATAGAVGMGLPPLPAIDFSKFGPVDRVALTRIQKISGPALQRSWHLAPMVTQHDDADITELEAFRQAHKDEAKAKGFALTPLVFVMKAVVRALQIHPRLNASLDPDGDNLILKRYYHLGVAVDTDDGLMVPVVRDVDKKSLMELAQELAELSEQARARQLKPAQIQGASFTISSLGGIGGTYFTPIVNVPEVAILGVSRHRWAPVYDGSAFVPRLMLPLSLTYDHRVVDGALAVRFTTTLAGLLADIRELLL
jgi:pyruvate dehydrogenase E2 component (dihydrolipoamide acetyltransferase)